MPIAKRLKRNKSNRRENIGSIKMRRAKKTKKVFLMVKKLDKTGRKKKVIPTTRKLGRIK